MDAVCGAGGGARSGRRGLCRRRGRTSPLRRPTMRTPTAALVALATALVVLGGAAAQSRCVTYFVATPAAPFTYKAGFTKATWPKVRAGCMGRVEAPIGRREWCPGST